ncbi:restriction endonuclease [Schlesneria sp.]|uniref:restriction endonuclease n=1 Tax=Schlesneria sp. TaxID=2762018 RepID=UPI002F1554F9
MSMERRIKSLEQEAERNQNSVRRLREERAAVRKRLVLVDWFANFARVSTFVRELTDSTIVWRPGVVIVGTTLIGGIQYALTRSLLWGAIASILAALFLIVLLYIPPDEQLESYLSQLELELESHVETLQLSGERLVELEQDSRRLSQELHSARLSHQQAQVMASSHYRRTLLLNEDWRAMRSVQLEDFLARVFTELGYAVEPTKTTGDQGVDLVISRSGKRIAVQVKGYEGSVSNAAVQEAHAGMSHYQCHFSCAITNSTFTRGARDLARSVRCSLIDGEMMPSLILGKLDLPLEGELVEMVS